MGIAKAAVKLMLKEAVQRPLRGTVLQLGKQGVWITYKELQEIAKEFNYPLQDPGPITLSHNPLGRERNCIDDLCLFKSLGFSSCRSLDGSNYEGADYIFDLNQSEVPKELCGQFDFIIDGGTLEHVFHVPNVLKNIYFMLRIGGRIIHLSPSTNHIDHGFYMFSPILFWEFYKTNQFVLHSLNPFRYEIEHDTKPWRIYDYVPGCLENVSAGGLDDKLYGVCCIAEKTKESTGTLIPHQRKKDIAENKRDLNLIACY
jgi:SAM-dependent methyltransferase